jgi:uncharacterized protein YbaP (TraB family)
MFFFRYACCLLALCIAATCTYGQQRTYPKSLLWRITGNGLTQPSYLFGTIHLTDKRLFRLGDSVYHAIEKTEGLAIEVNPDEMGAYYINKAINDTEGAKLQELLNEKDFKKYSTALAKKFKKPASEITTGDIVTAKNKWMADYLEKGEMATFLDAYLYNIARRQGKWVGGVEDIADQTGILDDLVDKSDIDMLLATDTGYIKKATDNMMEHMAEMYMNQDLSGIESISMTGSAQFHDLLMIKRNVKMARRIDSLTALRTMFIAVGAAHLPGDSGVIHLLQTKGFTVEPVFSSKKIEASNYTFKEVKLPWTESEDKQGLYKVAMPGNAIDIKMFGIIDIKFLFDIFTLSNYCTMSVVSPRSTINKDSMLQELAQRMFQTTDKITAKKVTNSSSGIEGKEYIHTLMGQRIRMQAFIHENVAYVAYMNAVKKEMLTSEDAERFFNSFIITKKQLAAPGDHLFVDSVMGVSMVSPAELTYNKKLSTDSDGWHISAYAGADISGGRYVMLFSKDISPGLYLSNDTAIQQGLIQNMRLQYPELKIDSINLQGYNGIVLKGANAQQKGFFMQSMSLIKNNRNIVLLVVSDSAQMHSPETQKIFNSLQFIPPASLPWQVYTTTDSLFSARVPGPFRTWNTDGNHYTYSFDTTTASTYFIMPDTLGKYVWFENDSLFWDNTVTRYTEKYQLLKKTNILYNNQPAMELLVKEDVAYKRMRLILHDDKVIEVMVIGDSNFVYNPNATAYLNSFRINVPQQNRNWITQSKAPLLLQDIASKDSTVRSETGTALFNTAFHKKDIPLLHEALFKRYLSLYSNEEDTYTNMRLALLIGQLKDSSTVPFIKEQYPLLTGDKEVFRNAALATLANLYTSVSYTALATLIDQYGAPKDAIDFQTINLLKDSLALTATIFNTLQKLAKDSTHGPNIADVALALLDSGFVKKAQLVHLQSDFISTAKKLLAPAKKEQLEWYIIDDLLALIGRFNTTAGYTVIRSYLSAKDLYIKKEAAIQLIRNKQPVPAEVLLKLAADDNLRTQLYHELKELKKTALFPAQYATQQYFGKSAMYEMASDDYNVKKITFLGKRTAKYKGKQYTFYLYHVVMEDDEPAGYLGVAGGYKPGSTTLETAVELSGIHWDETWTAAKVNAQFKTFLKNMEKASDSE